jgi:hypothetical protein
MLEKIQLGEQSSLCNLNEQLHVLCLVTHHTRSHLGQGVQTSAPAGEYVLGSHCKGRIRRGDQWAGPATSGNCTPYSNVKH